MVLKCLGNRFFEVRCFWWNCFDRQNTSHVHRNCFLNRFYPRQFHFEILMGFVLVSSSASAQALDKKVTRNLCMHVLLQSHLCVPLCCRLKLGAVIKQYWICKGSAFVILKVWQSCCFVLENGNILIDMGDRWLRMFPEVSLCYCEIQSVYFAEANKLGNVHVFVLFYL